MGGARPQTGGVITALGLGLVAACAPSCNALFGVDQLSYDEATTVD